MKREFIIPGKVQAKQRPRFNGRYTYTPEATKNYENWVKICYLEKYAGQPILENALEVKIIAYYEIPKSATKKKKQQMLNNEIFPTIKPDTDNIAKSILDSLNNIAFLDDKQVILLSVEKYYSPTSCVSVQIKEIWGELHGI